jgi:rhodanese-related sulfurtransferase
MTSRPAQSGIEDGVSTIVPAMTELFGGVPETDAAEAADLMAAGALMVDIREADEWEEVRIPGAIFKPLSEINDWFEELPRDRTVILQCRSGNRSAMAAAALIREAGMKTVVNLTGGIIAWHQAGHPIDLEPLPH